MSSTKLFKLPIFSRNLTELKRSLSSIQMIPKPDTRTEFKTLAVSAPKPFVFHVELNRPDRYNAFNKQMWIDIRDCFRALSSNPDCRAIVLSGAGKHFTAGLDLVDAMNLGKELGDIDDVARKGIALGRLIELYQDSVSSLEICTKPVISATHSACIGAGVDLITAADIRYCTEDGFFQVKEVDIGMAADVGSLQRLPKAIGSQSLARELCLTGRRLESSEAKTSGLVNRVFQTKDEMLQFALDVALNIAEKSPIAVQATKSSMVYSQNRPNQEGLEQIRNLNKLYLQAEDFANATAAQLMKGQKPEFSKL